MLTTLTNLKLRAGITGTEDDTLLTAISNAVEARFNGVCNRVFARSATAELIFDADRVAILLPCYPVESLTGLYLRDNATSSWTFQDGLLYELDAAAGILHLTVPIGTRWQRCRAVYAGGYVLPGTEATTGQTALPTDVEQAAIEQALHIYHRRHDLRFTDTTGETAAARQLRNVDLLESVQAALAPYRRLTLV